VYWKLRARLTPRGRRVVRRTVDALAAPVAGSLRSVETSEPMVAITFDDGPDAETTPRLLDMLAEEAVHASFYVLLDRAAEHPHLVRDAVRAGHEIELHGRDHRRLTSLDPASLVDDLRVAREELSDLSGRAVKQLRPPFGAQNWTTYRAARRAGFEVVVWRTDLLDWIDQSVAELADRVDSRVARGDIVLLHEALEPDPERPSPPTSFDRVAAARAVIRRLRERGLEPTSVGRLVSVGRARRTAWFRP
jgi:peptidoglycan/xylan/chitin deacetylase (PgdA/CDA1 family)